MHLKVHHGNRRSNGSSAREDGGEDGTGRSGLGGISGGGGRGGGSWVLDGKVARVLGGGQHDSEGELLDFGEVRRGSPVGVAHGLGAVNGGDVYQEDSVVAVRGVDQLNRDLGGGGGDHVRGSNAS